MLPALFFLHFDFAGLFIRIASVGSAPVNARNAGRRLLRDAKSSTFDPITKTSRRKIGGEKPSQHNPSKMTFL